ncbi:hypothetical protein, partial [Acinetobacter baumannii]|uniref:hypothetical protein n=1 Tax=Acinetobacter baumannii TaxID=470 RepID=UPI0033334370
THNIQDMEAAEMSSDTNIDKQDLHIYNGILLTHKRNKIRTFVVMWMDLESVIPSEVKSEREKQTWSISAYIWNLGGWYQ